MARKLPPADWGVKRNPAEPGRLGRLAGQTRRRALALHNHGVGYGRVVEKPFGGPVLRLVNCQAVGWRFVNERRAVNLDPNCGWARGKADVLYVADAFEVMRKVNAPLGEKWAKNLAGRSSRSQGRTLNKSAPSVTSFSRNQQCD